MSNINFVITFDDKHLCGLSHDDRCMVEGAYDNEYNDTCTGYLKDRPEWCPLRLVEPMNHPAADRPDCAGTNWPNCYIEVKK